MPRIAILGATGYPALELMKILLRHEGAEITAVTARQEGKPPVAMIHPSLTGRLDLLLEDLSPAEIAARAECIFCCLPHGVSATVVPALLDAGMKVIDLGADYRLKDPEAFTHWYGQKHADPERLGKAVYGLPELYRKEIAAAQLVANPGGQAACAILALAPLLKARLVEPRSIIVDAKSGLSTAGRTPKLITHFVECNESVSAYNVGRHRHTPEIEQVLTAFSGTTVEVVFTAHIVPMDRGTMTTIYAQPTAPVDEAQLLQTLRNFYEEEPYVRVVDHLPGTKDSLGANFCDITARTVRGRVVLFSSLDNLLKGAAGAAVQNFNLMYGYPETTGLI